MSRRSLHKPYTICGAGPLTATVWKKGSNERGWNYEFNVVRTSSATGRVTQRFRPRDLLDFVKLVRVLSFTLADDGCLGPELRQDLDRLAAKLRKVLSHGVTRQTKR